ncbi:multidrug efflux SMR transporter [Campylobacter sp. LH-2024]|uniref:DMT family transporter n=1 Tax=Campylobacter TaxID=194 RepID=UPI0019052B51|nr:SMR family transporter [Campylobacter sp. 2018MI35]MBZ7927886.1 QacE family quaternary ammonium compound efflux SMR transporter [Campylobacter sp. RM10542]MBZ7932664.1 QacE family quaternary ammonium compound efflux SMR transporter [Campylobacter sp. RM10543]MBZ7940035.1 QacE family quaternary ammonium compound efflux SMR transporter [Campylobacter sp. W0047]MBZ7943952.1 QacE family quaternary ammonium compound efflux SMR transporter [Campylobacter sp. RM13744]MBZ7945014.1 QacE family quate
MAWIFLIIAGICEIIGVIIMKKYVNTHAKKYLLALIVCFMCSFMSLSLSMQSIAMSIAYAIWTGIGAVGSVVVGVVLFKESKNFLKLFFILVILVSTIALKLLS